MANLVNFVLTCESRNEADNIARVLLEKRLIACAKFAPVECIYWWEGKIDSGLEVLLVMDSREDLFDAAEAEVAKLHGYNTFVLQAFPATRVSKKAVAWLDKELRPIQNKKHVRTGRQNAKIG